MGENGFYLRVDLQTRRLVILEHSVDGAMPISLSHVPEEVLEELLRRYAPVRRRSHCVVLTPEDG